MAVIFLGSATGLAAKPKAECSNEDVAYTWLNNAKIKMVYDSSAENETNISDTMVRPYFLRPDDYGAGPGVWVEDVGADQPEAWNASQIATSILKSIIWAADAGAAFDLDNSWLKMGGSNVDAAGSAAGIFFGLDSGEYKGYMGDGLSEYIIFNPSTGLEISGDVTAASGILGGWSIAASSLTSTNIGLHSGASAQILLGHATSYASAKIGLKNDGSGKLASGNISWDTSGNVSLGSITIQSGSGYANLSDKPTTLGGINAGEGTKLAGIEAGADVTASHTAAAISGQGALATKSSVNLNSGEVTNKSLANLDSTANTKLSGIEAGATEGATWGSDLNSIPSILANVASVSGSWTSTNGLITESSGGSASGIKGIGQYYGVWGDAENTGIYGTGAIGVWAHGTNYGLYAVGSGTGNRNYIEGDLGIEDTSPSFTLDVNGTGRITGALTTGGSDPPYEVFWAETRQSVIERIKRNVPPEFLNGCALFFNSERGEMELFLMDKGEFRNLQGNVVHRIDPITSTFPVKKKHILDSQTGEVISIDVPVTRKKYRVKKGFSLNRDTGVFFNKSKKQVSKEEAIEVVTIDKNRRN